MRATTAPETIRPEKTSKKLALDLGSDDDDGSTGGVKLKINEEYAKRFEHNKKREEKQRLEEKYTKKRKRDSDSDSDRSDNDSDSSSDEEEDEFGDLADEVADEDILATITAIRAKDPRVYDGQTRFFRSTPEDEEETEDNEKKKGKTEKPMFLKDYHRMNLLNGTNPAEEEEDEEPKTYLEEQEALKRDLVRDMHNAAEGVTKDDEDDEDFLTTKDAPVDEASPPPLNPETADPENPDEYLQNFLASKAWLPKDRKNAYGPAMESDDSEEEDIADQFEQGFNLRFEDPTKAAQLVGHARGAVKAMTARKDSMSARKRAREAKQQKKEEEKREREIEKGRLRALKVDELMSKVKQIKKVAGLGDEDEDPEMWKELLKGGFSEDKWDELMAKRFGDEYYGVEEKELPEKPTWDDDDDDDIDVADIAENGANADSDGGMDDADAEETNSKGKRKSRKDYEKEKREKKKLVRETRKEVEKFVDENIDLDDELTQSKPSRNRFRYREVTPETFGLTPLDILAAEDGDLNEYAGLKRYAAFRPKERKKQDKKKYSKKRNLREWRKAVFGDENGPTLPKIDAKQTEAVKRKSPEVEDKVAVAVAVDGEGKKKRRRKRK